MMDSALLAPQDWSFPVPIAYGPGRLAELAVLCSRAGMSRPLIVTDRGSRGLPFIAAAEGHLRDGGLPAAVFSEISPNPRDDEVAAGKAALMENGCDGVVAIGGGSGMDGAKAICLVARNDIDLWDFDYTKPVPKVDEADPFPPLITVPTTAGTGAETEGTGMITDTVHTMKLCVDHPRFQPAWTLLDPELTLGLPRDLTAWTGCDAMVHAIEAYCVPGFHPLCDGAALEGLRLISRWLRTAVREPSHLEARGAMLVGSCLAGIAFLKGLGLVHSISHMVGAQYDTHHGLTNAVMLPAVLRFNGPTLGEKTVPMAQAMALPDTSFDAFYGAICQLLDDLRIPRHLADLGVAADQIPGLAERAFQDALTQTNPRPASPADIQAVMEEAMTAGR